MPIWKIYEIARHLPYTDTHKTLFPTDFFLLYYDFTWILQWTKNECRGNMREKKNNIKSMTMMRQREWKKIQFKMLFISYQLQMVIATYTNMTLRANYFLALFIFMCFSSFRGADELNVFDMPWLFFCWSGHWSGFCLSSFLFH